MCHGRLRRSIVFMHSHMTTHLVAAMQAEAELARPRLRLERPARRHGRRGLRRRVAGTRRRPLTTA
jgi:hypothetical protein